MIQRVVRSYLIEKFLNGELSVGQTVKLPPIARDLGCSVTPIRETMVELTYPRVVKAIPNRGFVVAELTAEEAALLYPMVADLECGALDRIKPEAFDFPALRRLNTIFRASASGAESFRSDLNFHRQLLQLEREPFLDRFLSDLKLRIFFYERTFLDTPHLKAESFRLHDELIDQLVNEDITAARDTLRRNWMNSLAILEPMLRERPN